MCCWRFLKTLPHLSSINLKQANKYKYNSLVFTRSPSCHLGTAQCRNLVSCCKIRLGLTKIDHVSARRLTSRPIYIASTEVNWTENVEGYELARWERALRWTISVKNVTVITDFNLTLLITGGLYHFTSAPSSSTCLLYTSDAADE